ncbi:MAG: hypothetical protein WCO63_14310 [Bacteroidota bacterium]
MKKTLITLALLGIVLFANAQSLSLSDSLGPIANNGDVYISTNLDQELVALVFVTNNAATSKTIECRKKEIYKVTGSVNYFCWGACYLPNTFTGSVHVPIPAGTTNQNNFSGHYACQGNGGISIIRYTFFDVQNPLDTVCYNVHYSGCTVGLDELSETALVSAPYPNPANESIGFTIGSNVFCNRNSFLEIRSVLGELLCKIKVSEGNPVIKINTSSFVPGLYSWTLIMDDSPRISNKFVVIH